MAAGALVARLWSCYAINGGPDLFVVLPFAAVGIAACLVAATSGLARIPARGSRAAVVVVAVAVACVEAVATRQPRLPSE